MHILNLGTLQVDEGWVLRPAQKAPLNPTNQHRDLILAAGLIDHPDLGLILFETGCAQDVDISWGAPFTDLFPRTVYTEEMKLPNTIKAAGYDIKDFKALVMGHLHLDHFGALEHFIDSAVGTEVPIYVHEEEFKYACWAVGTGTDSGVYLGDYVNLTQLKWKTLTGIRFDLCQGITLHHAPGHTPGLYIMQVNLEKMELSSGLQISITLQRIITCRTLRAGYNEISRLGLGAIIWFCSWSVF
ncbi:hypothetical protein KC349_g2971 [Hortaea werneckii]|nr:hypothetical protein KC349_g2971 [Hortaea werneckii]